MSVTEHKLRKIKALASIDGLIDVACFQFVNIEAIKKALGNSWPAMRKKIFYTGGAFLEHRLSSGDVIIQSNDGFLVVFEHLSHSAAEDAAKDLSVGMLAFFLGDEYLKKVNLTYSYKSVLAEKIVKMAHHLKPELQETPKDKTTAPPALILPQIKDITTDDIDLIYYPIWHSVTNKITCYTLLPQRVVNGLLYTGAASFPKGYTNEFRLKIDIKALRKAQEDFVNLLASGKNTVVSVTVSYQLLKDSESRAQYIRQLRELPEQYSKHILVCVDEIPKGTPEFQLVQNLKVLQNFCGAVLVHNLDPAIHPSNFKGCGVSLFGFNLTTYLKTDELQQNELQKITKFCLDAKKYKAEVYFTNVTHRRQIIALKRTGVQYFSGDSVGGKLTELDELKILTPKDIFQRVWI